MGGWDKESAAAGMARFKELKAQAFRAHPQAACGFSCCSCCLLLGVPIVLMGGGALMMSLAGVYGYDLATDVQVDARVGASTGDWSAVESSFQWKPWLSQVSFRSTFPSLFFVTCSFILVANRANSHHFLSFALTVSLLHPSGSAGRWSKG